AIKIALSRAGDSRQYVSYAMVTGCSASPLSSTNGSSCAKVKYRTYRRGVILSNALGAGAVVPMTGETPLGAGAAPPGGGPAVLVGGAGAQASRPPADSVCSSAGALRDTLAHRRPERLVQIGDDVVHVLNADGQANQVGAHARGPLFFLGQLLVGRARGVNDQRFGVTHVGQKRKQLDVVDEA